MKRFFHFFFAVFAAVSLPGYVKAGSLFTQIGIIAATVVVSAATGGIGGAILGGVISTVLVDDNSCDVNIIWGCNSGPAAGSAVSSSPTNLSATQSDYCTDAKPQPTLSWTYTGSGTQSAYEIDISRDDTTDTIFHSTGKVPSSSTSYVVPINILDFGNTYHWRVRTWDASDTVSNFATSQFSTPPHRGPAVSFTWMPPKPVREAEVTFTDGSTIFGGAAVSAWQWTFPPATILLTPPTTDATEQVKFARSESQSTVVRLAVTDSDNLTCSASKDLTLTSPVLDVKEIK